jgi:hypothetical protein
MDSGVAFTGFFIFAASPLGACALAAAADTVMSHAAAAPQMIALSAFDVPTK